MKQLALSLWSTPNENQLQHRSRKRRRLNSKGDEDCVITQTVKRHKKNEDSIGFFSNVYQMVVGKSIPSGNMQRSLMNEENSDYVIVEDDNTNKTISNELEILSSLPTVRYQEPSGASKRTGLRQISNSTVLDLTRDDGEEDYLEVPDDDDDLQVTSVKYNMAPKNPIIKTYSATLTPQLTPVKTPLKKFTLPHATTIENNYRLEEKERYRGLLSAYTNVILPEYSESLSPIHQSPKSSDLPATVDLTSSEQNIETPLFYRKAFQKPFDIDLTRSELSFNLNHDQVRENKFVDLTRVESVPDEEIVEIDEQSVQFKSKNSNNSSQSDAILNCGWIQKWRDVIDPVQLERERQIKTEVRKLEAMKKKRLEEIEKLSQDNEFPALTNEMLSKVKKSLCSGNPKEVFIEGFNAEITRGDIATLRESTWLNDEVVNFYFNLLKARSESNPNLPKVHVFNTFFYPKIMKTGHAGVKRWTRKVDIFAVDIILVPVHLGMHWCLAVVDFKKKEIVYYDSLKGQNPGAIQGLRKYLADESLDKKKKAFDFTGWKELMPKDIPEQMNGCDCGVFMSKYAEYKSRYAKFTFTQENMPYFRKRMIYEILSKKLL